MRDTFSVKRLSSLSEQSGWGWGKLLDIKYILISLKRLFETFLILRRNERDINVHVSSYKALLILVKL